MTDAKNTSNPGTEVEVATTGAAIAAAGGVSEAIHGLNSGVSNVYSSIKGTDFASRKQVLAATTTSVPLSDNLGKPIDLVNIVVQAIELPDENTGELVEVPRTVLIAADGTAYHAVSGGIFRSLENLLGILGEPAGWPEPVTVVVTKEGKAPRAYFTIRLA